MPKLTLDEILKFIDTEDRRLRKKFAYEDESKRVLARTVKISEEFGELCDEVLASIALQRQEKLANHRREQLEDEFADVLIVVLMLARTLKVDVRKALENKMKKIDARYNK